MDRHSTLVVWAKTLLPLGAIALLSTLFLVSQPRGVEDAEIPFADLDALARDEQVSAPSFSGVADDGSVVAISADSARPAGDARDGLVLQVVRGTVDSPGGRRLTFAAGDGLLETEAGTARFSGPVTIETTGGYRMEAATLHADLEAGRLMAQGPVTAEAPYGSLSAGQLVAETPEGGGARLVFQDGVRLVYQPQPDEGTPR
ncbi:hypothetical protein [Histidinibacterium lentulum]|uniref:LPS export ABC transporter periplasmic protein LptC n=1 Tax=Histidinibacterium lentulum TaxID=2480588 RepID=A0A3N2R6P7_9RHOB|nr:hypothetical protein [Histidinibacterium lentulum]ROU03051.1 hypothetical protein EAT49_07090 [Histidinibacterium lentulum]